MRVAGYAMLAYGTAIVSSVLETPQKEWLLALAGGALIGAGAMILGKTD